VQAVGLSLEGAIPSRNLGLNYVFEYGSSDTIRARLNGIGSDDENNGNQVNIGIFARPDRLPRTRDWRFLLPRQHHDDRNLSVRYGQTILNAHVVYVARGLEFLNEGVVIRHAELNGTNVFNMPGAYSLISKQFAPVQPFFRFQYLNMNPQSALHEVSLRYGPSFGTRYDFNRQIALKLQFDRTWRKSQPVLNGVQTQLSFAF